MDGKMCRMKWQRTRDEDLHREIREGFRQMCIRLDHIITAFTTNQEHEMTDFSKLQDEVAQNTDATQSAVTLLNKLAQEIRDNANDPAAIQDLANQLDQNTQSLASAISQNADTGGSVPSTGDNTGGAGAATTGGATVGGQPSDGSTTP